MAAEVFYGSWKIVECVNISKVRNVTPVTIEGAIFTLEENGEIKWDLSQGQSQGQGDEGATRRSLEDFPLFQCDCYEVVRSFVGVCIQMGVVSGHIFEFWVDRPVPRDVMLLTFEGWCMIQCQQITVVPPPLDFPFSLIPALLDACFADMKLQLLPQEERPDDGSEQVLERERLTTKEFEVHAVIMELAECKDSDILASLSSLPSDVVEVALFHIYSQSLPSTLSEGLATRCIELVGKMKGIEDRKNLRDFINLCENYVYRIQLKNRIVNLVNEVHICAERMAKSFRDHAVIIPSRFCHVIKWALRDAAVALVKLVELCVLYGEESEKLERNERLEILRFAKTRLPIFLTQFVAMLRNIKHDFSTVRPVERNDVAAHVAPEIETLLGLLSVLMKEARDACSEIWSRWSSQSSCSCQGPGETEWYYSWWSKSGRSTNGSNTDPTTKTNDNDGSEQQEVDHEQAAAAATPSTSKSVTEVKVRDSLSEALFGIFRKREVLKLHQLQGQLAAIYLYLIQKKENFEDMTTAVKIRCVSRNLEQLLEELPVFLLRLEEIMIAFDDRFQWKDFKFCLQLAISQVCQTVHHLRKEQSHLQKFFMCLSELVQRDEFLQSLVNLKLIEVPAEECEEASQVEKQKEEEAKKCAKTKDGASGNGDSSGCGISYCDDLNLIENLCTPKKGKENLLAQNAKNLFETKNGPDMVFVIAQEGQALVEIPAHRVIIGARCDWFRRALSSGMKESIEKKIVIYDCPSSVFELFLCFIYTGEILSPQQDISLALDVLVELITLADRYEMDTLKLYSEQELASRHLDESSVIYLLSMADQYNARTLRGMTMEYIASHPDIMAKEMFEELSPELQMEVYDITMWSKPKKVFSIPEEVLNCPRYMLVPDSPSDDDSTSSGGEESRRATPSSGKGQQDLN